MKTLLSFPLLLLSLVSFPSWSETMDDLVERDGLYYKKFSNVPFFGEIKTKEANGWIMGGTKNGDWTEYHSNGQLWSTGDYAMGNRTGPWVFYYINGRLSNKGNYKNGKRVGFWIFYHDNGEILTQGEYKNDKKEGRWIYYDANGVVHKDWSGLFKDGVKISD